MSVCGGLMRALLLQAGVFKVCVFAQGGHVCVEVCFSGGEDTCVFAVCVMCRCNVYMVYGCFVVRRVVCSDT